MRSTTQVLVLLGLVAFFAFQVEKSSAASLRDPAAKVNTVNNEEDLFTYLSVDNGIHINNALTERLRNRLHFINMWIQKNQEAVYRLSKLDVNLVPEKDLQKISEHLTHFKTQTHLPVDVLGGTEMGDAIQKLQKDADQIIEKIQKRQPNQTAEPEEDTDAVEERVFPEFSQRLPERLKTLIYWLQTAQTVSQINVEDLSSDVSPKELLQVMVEQATESKDRTAKIAAVLEATEIGDAARALALDCQQVIKKLQQALEKQ